MFIMQKSINLFIKTKWYITDNAILKPKYFVELDEIKIYFFESEKNNWIILFTCYYSVNILFFYNFKMDKYNIFY